MASQSNIAGMVPGPRASLLGWRGQTLAFLRDPVAFMSALHRAHGPVAAWLAGNAGWMFGFGPEYNQQVLSDATRFLTVPIAPLATPRDSALARLTNNLLTMNGATHRQQRRLMLPAFHRKRVETYRDEMVAIADHMLSTWEVGQRIDIARAMQRLTLCIASRTLFGADAELDADNIGRLTSRWMAMIESGAVFLFPKDWPATPFRHLMKLSNQLEARMLVSIAQKRANPGTHHDVLAMLVQARDEDGTSMTDEELIGQAGVIFVAGHETSSNALTWTLFLLSQHPRVLADLADELAGELRGAAPSAEQLGRLPLLDCVIKESMRLLPPVIFLMRNTTAPTQFGPYVAPAGANLTISPYITHRLPELYASPRRFLPERWAAISPGTYEYIPFGAGPHMCIGSTFALMEIKLVLAMLLQRYRLELAPGARVDRRVTITMSPRHGLPMIVAPRERAIAPSAVRGNINEMVELA